MTILVRGPIHMLQKGTAARLFRHSILRLFPNHNLLSLHNQELSAELISDHS